MTYDETPIYAIGQREPVCIIRRCRHDENVLDVTSIVTGELLARLCPDCGTQLETSFTIPAHGVA